MVRIVHTFDPDCESGRLEVNGVCVGSGNYWDYHPDAAIEAIQQTLDILGLQHTFSEVEEKCEACKAEEDEYVEEDEDEDGA